MTRYTSSICHDPDVLVMIVAGGTRR